MRTPPTGGAPPITSKAAAAEHIALEATRLARIANSQDFRLLAYLIDMVVLEAWREASEPDGEASDGENTALASG